MIATQPAQCFPSPADLPSYAVIDFSRSGGLGAEHVVKALFDTMERHGMRILNNGRSHLNQLIVRHPGGLDPDSVSPTYICFYFIVVSS